MASHTQTDMHYISADLGDQSSEDVMLQLATKFQPDVVIMAKCASVLARDTKRAPVSHVCIQFHTCVFSLADDLASSSFDAFVITLRQHL